MSDALSTAEQINEGRGPFNLFDHNSPPTRTNMSSKEARLLI